MNIVRLDLVELVWFRKKSLPLTDRAAFFLANMLHFMSKMICKTKMTISSFLHDNITQKKNKTESRETKQKIIKTKINTKKEIKKDTAVVSDQTKSVFLS